MRLLAGLFLVALGAGPLRAQLTVRATGSVPAGATVYIAGTFNGWNPSATPLARDSAGWSVTLPASVRGAIEFKLTLGSWATVEDVARNRTHVIPAEGADTLVVRVNAWAVPRKPTASRSVRVLSDSFAIPQLGRTRRVWLYLPPGYATGTRRYPVLYVHDGQNVFDDATSFAGEWGIDETLDSLHAGGAPDAIVVAIDNSSSRLSEYNAFKGEGAAYVDFLVKTLKPYVDAHYRTRRDAASTGVMGSSMGGLISLYAALRHPEVFGRAGVFSCACWIARPAVYDFARRARPGARLYFVAGELETKDGEPARDQREMVDTLVAAGWRHDVNVRSVVQADGKHSEWFWRREFPAAYLWLFGRP